MTRRGPFDEWGCTPIRFDYEHLGGKAMRAPMTPFPMEGCYPSTETMMRLNDDLRRELDDERARFQTQAQLLEDAQERAKGLEIVIKELQRVIKELTTR